jgi:hypothetical protein
MFQKPLSVSFPSGGYMSAAATYGPVGSPPLQMGSPYSGCSSPAGSQVYSPEHFEHQLPGHSQGMGSPPYPTSSPYQSTIRSPGQYSGSTPSPTYSNMDTVEVPHLISFSNAVTTCDGPMPGVFTGEPAIYSITHAHPQMVDAFSASHPSHLPPFAHVFEGPLHHDGQIPERHSSPESYCSDSGPVTIKQMTNEFGITGIEFYHPPTPPNMIEGAPNMMYPPEMCGHLPPEMCGSLPPLPNHLCPIPTLSNQGRRRPKQPRKVPNIEVDDSDIKDIPTSAQLWEFTLRVLKKPKYKYMVSWEKREEGLFRFNNAQAFAALWGKHRNRPQMSYDKVARALRYYYKRNILEQVGGRLTYRFTKRLSKLYLSDV